MQRVKKLRCSMEETMESCCKSGFFLVLFLSEPHLGSGFFSTTKSGRNDRKASSWLRYLEYRACRNSHAPPFCSSAPDAHSSRLLLIPTRLFPLLPSSSTAKIFPQNLLSTFWQLQEISAE